MINIDLRNQYDSLIADGCYSINRCHSKLGAVSADKLYFDVIEPTLLLPLWNLVLVKLELCECNKPGGRKKLLCSALPFLPSHANVVLCLALAAFAPRVFLPHQELEGRLRK